MGCGAWQGPQGRGLSGGAAVCAGPLSPPRGHPPARSRSRGWAVAAAAAAGGAPPAGARAQSVALAHRRPGAGAGDKRRRRGAPHKRARRRGPVVATAAQGFRGTAYQILFQAD